MATLAVVQSIRDGVNVALTAAAGGGDEFANTGREALMVSNGSGAPITVTIETPQEVDELDVADRDVVVPAGETRLIGPFPKGTYNDADGMVQITYSSVTTVLVRPIRIN